MGFDCFHHFGWFENPAVVWGRVVACRQQGIIPGGAGRSGAEDAVPGEQGAVAQTVQEPEAIDDNQPAIDGMQSGAAQEWIAHAAERKNQQGVQRSSEDQQGGVGAGHYPEPGDAPEQFAAYQGAEQQDTGPDKQLRESAALSLIPQVAEQPADAKGRQVIDDDAGCYQKQVGNLPHNLVMPLRFMPGYEAGADAQAQRCK